MQRRAKRFDPEVAKRMKAAVKEAEWKRYDQRGREAKGYKRYQQTKMERLRKDLKYVSGRYAGWVQRLMVRMRVGNVMFAEQLRKVSAKADWTGRQRLMIPQHWCPMCEEEVKGRGEDEMHYLLECSAWSAERKEYLEPMREQVERAIRRGSTRAEAVAILLGGSVRGVQPRSLRRAVREHGLQLRAHEAALAALID